MWVVISMRAAGALWTLVTANAPWAGRIYHTSVIDAASSIFVLGGQVGSSTDYNDVWRSADQGAARGVSFGGFSLA